MEILFDKTQNIEFEKTLIQVVSKVFTPLEKENFIPEFFQSLIICWDIDEYIANFNFSHGTDYQRMQSKTGSGRAKTLIYEKNNVSLAEIIIDVSLYANEKLFFSSILAMILHEKSYDYINDKTFYRPNLSSIHGQNLDYTTEYLFTQLFPVFFSQNILNRSYPNDIEYNAKTFLDFILDFKRQIRTALFDINSDNVDFAGNFTHLYSKFIGEIFHLSKMFICSGLNLEGLRKLEQTREFTLINDLIEEISVNHDKIIEGKLIDLKKLKELIFSFADYNKIEINQEVDTISIYCHTNPKLLYKEELVETEERIVAFLDILGFSNMIKEYEKKIVTSTLLQDLNSTLKQVIDNTLSKYNKDEYVGFEYKIFSDNICLSLPFFQTQNDFEQSLGILLNLVREFQFRMLSKNYLIRGGISTGSYYSNEHLIFSGGLVHSYKIESTIANYPRVVLDNSITDKLTFPNQNVFLHGTLLFSNLENIYFVNPFMSGNENSENLDFLMEKADFDDLFENTNEELHPIVKESYLSSLNTIKALMKKETVVEKDLDILSFLNNEIISLKSTDSKTNSSYRERVRKRTNDKKASPLEKVTWMRDLYLWHLGENLDEIRFTKCN